MFRRRIGPHHFFIAEFSSGRPMNRVERRLFGAAAWDSALTRAFEEVASRRRSPARMLDPRLAPHVVRGLVSPSRTG
jgi:hypothetical protein